MDDAMAFDLGADGRIRPDLRPWLPTTLFAPALGPQIPQHPDVIVRALRNGSPG